ncbi:hypothetical protein [Natrarchaeobius chitinivorans]|uniref:Uncharacterized protein n=1 Tax=Natrarchaeobius chitinivorans TaxID=1679083 RepID=A0A3N6PCK8_NATCH|nr:hypothetical protein [Natrarchaeobius chitinivorans]RQG97219.1 hypothetical protein EA473_03875 [Natrarchaeobius chitinivorans]
MGTDDTRTRRAILATVCTGIAGVGATTTAAAFDEGPFDDTASAIDFDTFFDDLGVDTDSETRTTTTTTTRPETEMSTGDGDSSTAMTTRNGITVTFDHCHRVHLEGSHPEFDYAVVNSWEAGIISEDGVYRERLTDVHELPQTVTTDNDANEPGPVALHSVDVRFRNGDRFTVSAPGNCRTLVERYVEGE